MTRNSSKAILNKAGNDTARENNKVRIPFADLTKRSTLPTLKTLTTRRSVGETRNWSITSLSATPAK